MKVFYGLIYVGVLVLAIGVADLIISIFQPPKDMSRYKRDPLRQMTVGLANFQGKMAKPTAIFGGIMILIGAMGLVIHAISK